MIISDGGVWSSVYSHVILLHVQYIILQQHFTVCVASDAKLNVAANVVFIES